MDLFDSIVNFVPKKQNSDCRAAKRIINVTEYLSKKLPRINEVQKSLLVNKSDEIQPVNFSNQSVTS